MSFVKYTDCRQPNMILMLSQLFFVPPHPIIDIVSLNYHNIMSKGIY